MKVFLSWSGNRSKLVAELLDDWLRCVLQAVRPWISTRDIDRGALWFNQISEQLSETGLGIVCLTAENKNKPWILFEAGALAKGLSASRVCTLLVDIVPTDIEDPLAQFNHTLPNKEGIGSLVRTLNAALQDKGLDERVLDRVFETYWPQFEAGFADALTASPSSPPPERTEDSLLKEILSNTRRLNLRVKDLESRLLSARPSSTGATAAAGSAADKPTRLGFGLRGLVDPQGNEGTNALLRELSADLPPNALMQPPASSD
jgi:lambda repressor-like predicted transcriptional regulator